MTKSTSTPIAATIAIQLGKAGSVEVDASRFTPEVRDYVFQYGLKQMLNDAHASVTALTNPDETERAAAKVAMAEKKLTSLYAGNVAQAREGGKALDPMAKAMNEIAETHLRKAVKAQGMKLSDDRVKSQWKALVAKLIEKNKAEWTGQAQAMVEAAQVPEEIIDLADLFADEAGK